MGREEFRKVSHVSAAAKGTISGLGIRGYELALQYFIRKKCVIITIIEKTIDK